MTTSLPAAESNLPWTVVALASGGTPPYRWHLANAPAWLQVGASDGRLWGTPPPALVGSVLFDLSVVDADDAQATRTLALDVSAASPALAPIVLAAREDATDGRFRTSVACATCHTSADASLAMRDAAGRRIGAAELWPATMMANSLRDPYFRAVLDIEQERLPDKAAFVQDACLRCHAPAAAYEAHQAGLQITLADVLGPTSRGAVGRDGTTCTLCHQIESTGLGTPASFEARFAIGDARLIYGGHADPFAIPMINNSGYTPTQAFHTRSSAMCATCHTVHTPAHDAAGEPLGIAFPEQMPYLEWRNSVFNDEIATPGPEAASCNACHMPSTDEDGLAIRTRIARNPGGGDFPRVGEREPFSRHTMVGGNAAVLRLLRDSAEELEPPASTAAFDAQIAATQDFLRRQTATVAIAGLGFESGQLAFDVRVANLAGHKLPTAYPSRRVWLRVRVRDAMGQVRWRSGECDARGRLLDAAGRPLALEAAGGPVEPHRLTITEQDQVQIYEARQGNAAGAPEHSLLHATAYLKDNRLLPRGWSSAHPDMADIQPMGVEGDRDFVGGSDAVRYLVRGLPAGAYTVEVDLLYQPLSARDIHEVFRFDHLRSVSAFRVMWETTDASPELLASAAVRTP